MRIRLGRISKFIAIGVLLALSIPGVANANQSPATCNSSNLDLTLTKDKTVVRPGDTITYSLFVSNLDIGASLACDITEATATITLPAPDGTPTGTTITLVTNADYLAGTPSTFIGTVDYIVDVNPEVIDVVAQGNVQGVLHDAPVNHAAEITKTVGTSITKPHLSLTKAADKTGGRANLTITYTYTLTNDSTGGASMTSVALTDDQCSPVTFVSGDSNGNSILENGETWTFACQQTFTVAGDFTNTAFATAVNSADALPVVSNTATTTVTVTGRYPGLPNTGSGPLGLYGL